MADKEAGVNFPVENGERPTTKLNQGCFEACVRKTKPALADEVKAVKKWRFGYSPHVLKQVELACQSTENALQIAKDGLDYLHTNMVFNRDGKEHTVKDAMTAFSKSIFETGVVKGTGKKGAKKVEVPYKDKVLTDNELANQIDSWARKGVIETSTAQALMNVVQNNQWTDLSDTTVVLCGAGSAMGPFPLLMAMGANVVGLDLPIPKIWERLIKVAKDSPGTLTFPLKEKCTDESKYAELAGCNLLNQTPEIANWLASVRKGERLIIGAYAYLDGPLFVRVSVAMDAVIESLMKTRSPKVGIAYLCTPTDAHMCPAAASEQAKTELRRAPMWIGMFAQITSMVMPKQRLVKNFRPPVVDKDGNEFYVCDAVVPDQGPNYILAKRLQHWRAVTAREQGHLVSTNVAPATATASVVSNKMFALAFKGMHVFKPYEVFMGPTSNAVMAMLLINDLRNPLSVANPELRKLRNPMELFAENSFHGGAWRAAYKNGSVGLPSALSAIMNEYIVKYWLLLYNVIQTVGWGLALTKVCQVAMTGDVEKMQTVWKVAGSTISWFQLFAIWEIVHAATGMVRSDPVMTAVQVYSRVLLVYLSNLSVLPQQSIWPFLMCFAWTLTETIRSAWLGLNGLGIKLAPLTWCRYSFFIVLYPMGVSGELGTIWTAWKDILGYKGYHWVLQSLQWICNTRLGFIPMAVMYAIGLPILFGGLLASRKKVLGKKPDGAKSGKKNQ
jgi:hypothetical protein